MAMPKIFDGWVERPLGCLPRTAQPGEIFPLLTAAAPLIPREKWKPISFRQYVRRVQEQDGIGSCNANAATGTVEDLRSVNGMPQLPLSAGNLYGRINGGSDRGSLLGDALDALVKDGVCTTAVVGNIDWRNWNAPGWQEEAKRFRILEAWDCPSFDYVSSATQLGFFTDYGIPVHDNFEVEPDGWLPDPRGGVRGYHAMRAVGLAYHKKRQTWGVLTVNSWSVRWGMKGFCVVPESYFKNVPFTDAWCVRSVVYDMSEESGSA